MCYLHVIIIRIDKRRQNRRVPIHVGGNMTLYKILLLIIKFLEKIENVQQFLHHVQVFEGRHL